MYIDRLKRKYQQILQEASSKEQSSQSHNSRSSKSKFKIDNKLKVLTEHSENIYKNNTYSASSSYVLALKQRIAQSTHNLRAKEEDCVKLKEEIFRKDEQIKLLQQQFNQSKSCIENSEKRVIEAKVVSAGLEKKIQALLREIEVCTIDKELALKQAQFFKKQNCKIKKEKKTTQKALSSSKKSLQQIDLISHENERLRQDIKRLQVLINDLGQDSQVFNFTDKHYLGKSLRQAASWFSQNLVGQVEHFLKKQQVGQANKQFLNNLVKFITKYASSISRNTLKGSQTNSRIKSVGNSSHYKSMSACEQDYDSNYASGTSFIAKTQSFGNSALKKSLLQSKYKKYDSRKYTDSFMFPEREEESTTALEKMLKEYKNVLKQALSEKQVKAKLILELTEEMSSAVTELFYSHIN